MKYFTIVLVLLFSLSIFANNVDVYPFTSAQKQQRFEKVISELRCLVCQNESLADSSAALAKDLRDAVYIKIQNGESETAIKDYLIERYGQFILFKPAMNAATGLLWFFPLLILIAGILFFGLFYKRHRIKK